MPSILRIQEKYKSCTLCELHKTRQNVVFGKGRINPEIMFIGEAPGANEDRQGVPFVGRAGAMLERLADTAGVDLEQSYITNVLMCRPPDNKIQDLNWGASCRQRLVRQINAVSPKAIVTLGRISAFYVLGVDDNMSVIRGRVSTVSITGHIYKAVSTWHPAYLLRKQGREADTYEGQFVVDLLKALEIARTGVPCR